MIYRNSLGKSRIFGHLEFIAIYPNEGDRGGEAGETQRELVLMRDVLLLRRLRHEREHDRYECGQIP